MELSKGKKRRFKPSSRRWSVFRNVRMLAGRKDPSRRFLLRYPGGETFEERPQFEEALPSFGRTRVNLVVPKGSELELKDIGVRYLHGMDG